MNYLSVLGLLTIDIICYRAVLSHMIKDFFSLNKLVKNGSFTDGVITNYIQLDDLDGRTQYAPLISYLDESKREYQYQSKDFSFSKPNIGAKIKVCYETNNPKNVIDNHNTVLLYKAFLIIVIVLVLVGVNIGIIYKIFT
jgi:hypothetical protein